MPAYSELPPTPSLSRWVECVWRFETEPAVTGQSVPPDACLDIIYDRANGLRAIGSMTTQQQFDLAPGTRIIGIRFRPGMARPFLGISPAELTDASTSLQDLWSHRARQLAQQLDDAQSIRDAMRLLLGSLRVPDTQPNPVQQAIEAIVNANGSADMDSSARQANLSVRQFRRRCLHESGLTPKLLSRILRFRHAYRAAQKTNRPNWSAIAAESEYFDQAHLIRDFREFSGATPMAVFSKTRTPLGD